MINAEIQCDIILKSFVPKVVPQLWMDPLKIIFRMANTYITKVKLHEAKRWGASTESHLMQWVITQFNINERAYHIPIQLWLVNTYPNMQILSSNIHSDVMPSRSINIKLPIATIDIGEWRHVDVAFIWSYLRKNKITLHISVQRWYSLDTLMWLSQILGWIFTTPIEGEGENTIVELAYYYLKTS